MKRFDVSRNAELQPVAMVLKEVKHRADLVGAEIMVVGATARDILIRQVVGSPPARATADIDVAVAVSSWDEVNNLAQTMQSAGAVHKFRVQGTEVDIIPFGEIESDKRTITWSNDHMMHVFGFREAFADAVSVRLPFETEVAVASLPAQSLLKIFAWRDRRYNDTRDAIDFRSILYSYHEGPYLEELYNDFGHLVEKNDFVPEYAGAERMGQEAKQLIATSDRVVVLEILGDTHLVERLSEDMGGLVDESHALVNAYLKGFD